jgi:chromosome segregation ATPase
MISMGGLNPTGDVSDQLFARDGLFDELFDEIDKRGRDKRKLGEEIMELGGEISQLKSEKRKEIRALRKEINALNRENRKLELTVEDAKRESEEADSLLKKLRQHEAELRTEKLDHMCTASRADRLKEDVEFYQKRERELSAELNRISRLLGEIYDRKLELDAQGGETFPGAARKPESGKLWGPW